MMGYYSTKTARQNRKHILYHFKRQYFEKNKKGISILRMTILV